MKTLLLSMHDFKESYNHSLKNITDLAFFPILVFQLKQKEYQL